MDVDSRSSALSHFSTSKHRQTKINIPNSSQREGEGEREWGEGEERERERERLGSSREREKKTWFKQEEKLG